MEQVAAVAVLLILALASLLVPIAIVVVGVSVFRQRKLGRAGTGVSPLTAEALTRATIANTRVVIVTGTLLSAALFFTGDEDYGLLVAYVPVAAAFRLWLQHRFLAYIESHIAPVRLHGNLLAVHCDRYIVVPRCIARSRYRALPGAVVVR